MIFIVTLYMQQVLGYSPLKTGVAWLAMSVAALVSAIITSQVVTKVGARYPIAGGLTLAAVGFGLLAGVPAEASYAADLLPGLLIFGIGLGMAFVAASIGALEGVTERDSGLASGLINTMQQVGGALGVAVLATIALSHSSDLLARGDDSAVASQRASVERCTSASRSLCSGSSVPSCLSAARSSRGACPSW